MSKSEKEIIDEYRSKLIFPVPVIGDGWETRDVWIDCMADYTVCNCGAYPVQMRGWYQKGTPCRITEYRCKHGHQWTGQTNCD